LKTIFGYNGDPSLTEALAYATYFAFVWIAGKLMINDTAQQLVSTD
jgi:hypothetical protein